MVIVAGVVIVVLIAVAGIYVISSSSKSTSTSTSESMTTTSSSSTATTQPIVKGNLVLGTFSSGGAANLANAGQSVEWLANDLPYFAENGLNVTIDGLQSSTVILQALQANQISIADMAATEPVKLTALNQGNFTAIMSDAADDCYTCTGGFLIATKNSITNINQLQGANIGISGVGGADQLDAIYVLNALGVNFNPITGINWIAVGTPAARVAGLQAGTLDGTITSTANLAALAAIPSVHILINSTEFAAKEPPAVPGIIVKTSFLQQHEPLLQEFVTSMIEANRAYASNESLWIQDATKAEPTLNATTAGAMYSGYAKGFSINGGINMTSAEAGIAYLYTTNEYITQSVPIITAQQFVNTTLVDNTLRQLGESSAFDLPGRTIAGATTTTAIMAAVLPLRYLEEEPLLAWARR